MGVPSSNFKTSVERDISFAEKQNICITRNGNKAAKITNTKDNKEENMKSLFGIANLPKEYDELTYDPY